MDPELQRALELVQIARERGRSDREINSALRKSGLPVNSIRQLETEIGFQSRQGGDTSTPSRGERLPAPGRISPITDQPTGIERGQPQADVPTRIQGQIATAFDMLPAGFGNELLSLVAPETAEKMREDQAIARRDDPIITGVTSIGSAVPASIGVGRLFGIGEGGLQSIGRGQGLLRRTATGAGQVGGAGATEAGLFAAGTAEGGPGERLEAAGRAAPFGAGLGAATGGLLGMASGAQQARREVLESGSRLADEARGTTGLSGRASTVAGQSSLLNRTGKGLIAPLDRGTQQIPRKVQEFVAGNDVLRRQLGKIDSAEARAALEALEEGDPSKITFTLIDDVRQQVRKAARGLADFSGTRPSVSQVREAQRTLRRLDDALDVLPGFTQSRRQFAAAGALDRGVEAGRTTFRRTADDFTSGFEALSNPIERRAYREGALHELASSLNTGDAVESFLRRASSEGSELQQKLRVIMGGDEALGSFLTSVRREKGVLTKAKILEQLTKAAGFLIGGTSLFGGAVGLATS